ncbi:MAG: Uma2 family endonuclease [Candidatus Schekmanbacteria bacterium]|nr:Uma2 family endonuclease [Candidatus Schekmanbacteria bacterium]
MTRTLTPLIPPGPSLLTVEDCLELPNDGKRYEIIEGDLYETPAPVPYHQMVSNRLQTALILALQRTGRGEVLNAPIGVILDRHTVVQPDLIFIRRERAALIGETAVNGPPDLVVEILSPSTRRTDLTAKSRVYARFEVESYWIVDPRKRRLELYRRNREQFRLVATQQPPETVCPDELPGLQIPLSEIFP